MDLVAVADRSARRAGPQSAHIWPWPAVLTVILYRSTDTKQLEAVLVSLRGRLLDAGGVGEGRQGRAHVPRPTKIGKEMGGTATRGA